MSKRRIIVQTATEALKKLWASGFLKEWKRTIAIEEKLAGEGYHFSKGDLCMAIKRAKYLTRRGNRGGYQYIQKSPFVEIEEDEE